MVEVIRYGSLANGRQGPNCVENRFLPETRNHVPESEERYDLLGDFFSLHPAIYHPHTHSH